MKLTNQQIINFTTLDISKRKLPIRLAHVLLVNLASMNMALEAYEKQKTELVKKYAKLNDEGQPIIEKGPEDNDFYVIKDMKNWGKDIAELLSAETEFNITTVPVEILEKCDEPGFDSFSMHELSVMQFMIED